MSDTQKSLNELRLQVDRFIEERDWSQFHDLKDLVISLNLEATEVLELFQWKSSDLVKKEELSHELADVLYWLLAISSKCDIDLQKAFENKMSLNAEKYPIDKSKGSSKKYTELEN